MEGTAGVTSVQEFSCSNMDSTLHALPPDIQWDPTSWLTAVDLSLHAHIEEKLLLTVTCLLGGLALTQQIESS